MANPQANARIGPHCRAAPALRNRLVRRGLMCSPVRGPRPQPVAQPKASTPSRRGLFGLVAGALPAGTVGLLALGTSNAEAQRVTTLALGEEGGRRPNRPITRAR